MTEQLQETNEYNLSHIITILWKSKYLIIAFVAVVSAIAVVTAVWMDNVYESRAQMKKSELNFTKSNSLLDGLGGLADVAGVNFSDSNVSPFNTIDAFLGDTDFLADLVKKHKLEEKIFDDYKKMKKNDDYEDNKNFYIFKAVRKNIRFSEDKKSGIMTLSYRNKDRFFAKKFLDILLIDISTRYKNLEISNIQQQIDNYKLEISKTDDLSLKNNLADLVANLIQKKIISQAQEFYGFDIIVKPSVPDQIAKVWPKRAVICIAAFMASLIIGCGAVIGADKYKRIKKEMMA